MSPPEPSAYSDASSSYWPTGWDFERLSRATQSDRDTLPEGELERMQAGLRDVLGQRGVGQLALYLYQQEMEREQRMQEDLITINDAYPAAANVDPSATPSTILVPNWLEHWEKYHQGASWGFIVFRVALYHDESRWKEFKLSVQKSVEEIFNRDALSKTLSDRTKAAHDHFKIQWIEHPGLADATVADLRSRSELLKKENGSGILQNLFLCASPSTVASVLTPSKENDTSSITPYLLAVSGNVNPEPRDGENNSKSKPVFKVAVEALIHQLWWQVDADVLPLDELTRWVKASDDLDSTGVENEGELEEIWLSSAPPIDRVRKRARLRGIPQDEE